MFKTSFDMPRTNPRLCQATVYRRRLVTVLMTFPGLLRSRQNRFNVHAAIEVSPAGTNS